MEDHPDKHDKGSARYSTDDVDTPRVAQWMDDEDMELEVGSSESESESEDGPETSGPSKLKSLQNNLSTLPLGALRSAQRALTETSVISDSESDESDSNHDLTKSSKGKEKQMVEWSLKSKSDIPKRANKNAPVEVTSKRPVTRKRNVVEVKKLQSRDPRFLTMTGEFSMQRFQDQYSFLATSHETELATLRQNLKRAQRLLLNSPRGTQSEREQEVQRLELAVKRLESLVNKDRRENVEREALKKVAKEEREKRKQGKGGWWMKESDRKELMAQARQDALAASGGQRAVKKALEKKQKKIGQKEKKSRPFPRSTAGSGKRPSKRSFGSDMQEEQVRSTKRRKVG